MKEIVNKNTNIDEIDFRMGSVILVDKQMDWTSFDVVNKIKWALKDSYKVKKIKVGHAGTLDPMATGMLIVCTGKKTKSIMEFQSMTKAYSGTIMLGANTASYDAETPIDETFDFSHLTEEMVREAASSFVGKQEQVPPMYSALKKDGVPLYKLAREGKEVERPPRPVEFYEVSLTRVELPEVDFFVKCTKGTYIRSLAYDLGMALKVGGYLKALRREAIGEYEVGHGLNPVLLAEQIRSKSRSSLLDVQ